MSGVNLEDLAEGSRNCVVSFLNVESGEEVLILANEDSDQLVIESLLDACREVGADPIVMVSAPVLSGVRLPRSLTAAWKASDATISLKKALLLGTEAFVVATFEYGNRNTVLLPPASATLLASEGARFPMELFWLIGKKVQNKLRRAKIVEIVDEKGTNLSAEPIAGSIGAYIGAKLLEPSSAVPGFFGVFPPGVTAWFPEDTSNGVVYLDAFERGFWQLKEPLKLKVEDGWVSEIEGGPEAKKLWKMLQDDANAACFAELGIGLNPKTEVATSLERGDILMATRHSGKMIVGLGNSFWLGGRVTSKFHADGVVLSPTIYVDDEVLVERGRLKVLDDPEVREVARKYGDPERVLSELP